MAAIGVMAAAPALQRKVPCSVGRLWSTRKWISITCWIFSTDNPEAGAAITSSLAVISQFENQVLVAVPAGVWHRTVARRVLPRAALQKPVLVEVSASVDSDRAIADAARPVRLWIGLLNTAFEDMVTFKEDVGNDRFAFFDGCFRCWRRANEARLDDRMALLEGQMASLQAGMQKLLAQPSAAQPPRGLQRMWRSLP